MVMWIILAVVVVLAGWLMLTYNSLIQGRNRVDESSSDIDVQLKRRYDLIPNLVETVKGYAKHEEGIFKAVAEARAMAMGAKSMAEHAKAENMLTESLKSIFAIAENYPALQASGNFMELQKSLTDAEHTIQQSRRFYNGNVRDFNTRIQVFPTNFVVGLFGFHRYEFFDAPEAANEPVAVKF